MERYEILEELARGANGVVYRARDRELGRTVALKRLRREAGSSAAKERFLREARVAARLDHPAIVPIYGFGLDGEFPYYTMPHVAGRPLAARIEEGPLEPREAARIARELARGLAYAHARHVVHRDVKPSNVLLAPDGAPLLADFGIARDLGSPDRLTQTGEVLGTPLYMSPEQMMPGRDVGPASDVFSLGCVLYEMLSGKPPFEGDSFIELSSRLLNDDPVPPSARRPGLPPELDALCLRCLRREPLDRPTAVEAAAELDRFLNPARRRRSRRALAWTPLLVALGAALAMVPVESEEPAAVVVTDPPDATVEVEENGVAGPPGAPLREGAYLLRIRAPGRVEGKLAVLIEPGREARYEVRLPLPEEVPPGMVFVAGGDAVLDSPGRGPRRMRMGPLFVDRTEVTCEDYARYAAAEGAEPPLDWRAGHPARGAESWAVTGVSADEAEAYADWCGKRLPTEEEWEFLARGVDGRPFPWGRTLPSGWPRQVDLWEARRGPVPAGSAGYDVSPFGIFELGGGVREWTATPGAVDPDARVVRGGAWSLPLLLRDATRYDELPARTRDRRIGFRCVKPVERSTTKTQRQEGEREERK